MTAKQLQKALQEKGIEVKSVEQAEPTLEDVFLVVSALRPLSRLP